MKFAGSLQPQQLRLHALESMQLLIGYYNVSQLLVLRCIMHRWCFTLQVILHEWAQPDAVSALQVSILCMQSSRALCTANVRESSCSIGL